MKVQPECVPCLLKRVLYETKLVDESKAYKTLKAATGILDRDFSEHINSAKLATKIHGEAYKILESKDVYEGMKNRSNSVAKKILPHAQELISASKDSLKSSILCSIVGNVLDFGVDSPIREPEEILSKFDILYNEGLGHDDTDKIEKMLAKGSNVLYFTDNAGEIVFDSLLIKELKKFDIHLTLVAKGEPILMDATVKDVKDLGLDNLVDEVETTNAFAVGVDFTKTTSNLKNKLEESDLIISKGMANWESFSDENYHPIAYLLRVKCNPVARGLGVEKEMNVAKLYE